MRIYLNLLLFFTIQVFSQEYDRTWGSYYGPSGAAGSGTSMLFDNNQNMHFNYFIWDYAMLGNSYYNQFATDGSLFSGSINTYTTLIVQPNGNLNFFGYKGDYQKNEMSNITKDSNANFYSLQYDASVANTFATPGTWFPNAVYSTADKYRLVKRDNLGNTLWSTFLPINDIVLFNSIITDDVGNVYIAGRTKVVTGVTSAGVQQEDFEIYGNNPNGLIIKLNPNGQLMWATYLPVENIFNIKYFNHHLYLITGSDLNPAKQELATTGAFQSQKSTTVIMKLNSDYGTRVWSTYFGPTDFNEIALIGNNLVVDSDGIFILGDSMDMVGNNPSYFGTQGCYQSNLSGLSDVFLSKFNLDGQRVWSTYFGSPGEELVNHSVHSLQKNGSNLFITFTQRYSPNFNSTNLATQGAYIDSPPIAIGSNDYHNFIFAKFNGNGNIVWSSYFGGANIDYGVSAPSIAISFLNSNTFYLFGGTTATEGIATPGAFQPTNLPNNFKFFVARFDKKTEMSTTETDHIKDLVLYNNPNNGVFALQGSVLQKKTLQMAIYDNAGRLILQQKLNKDYRQSFDFSHQLKTGNYFLELKDNKQLLKSFKLIIK